MFREIKKSFRAFFLFAITILVAGQINAQLVTNGSFESSPLGAVSGTQVEGWVIELAAGLSPAPVLEIVDTEVRTGNRAMKIVVNSIGTNAYDIQLVADSIAVVPGGTYRYSVWAKAESAGAVGNFTVGNYSYSEYGNIRPGSIGTQWTQFTFEFTITDQQVVARAPIHFSVAGNVGNTIYIDDMSIVDVNADKIPVAVEAESAEVGSDFSVQQDGEISYVKIETNTVNTGNPGTDARVITFEVTFPDTGSYNLFVRMRIGSGNFDDDSFFYGNGFGVKNSANDTDWVMVNGLAAAGFSGEDEIVHEAGGLGSGVWKWVNLSTNAYQSGATHTFVVDGELTQTFQIGAREDGMDIDKIAFGKSWLYYTVGNLDNGEPGSTSLPGDIWEGPPLASNQPKFVGNVHSSAQIANFEAYWNKVTPENAGKWGSVEGTRDVMNWSGVDAAYNLAKDNGFPFHFHVLVWGAQQPSWISALQPEEQLEEIREWFQAVADRYPEIDFLEVVNEPLLGHNPPDGTQNRANYKAALGGDGSTGWDWVINAFRMAREIFPAETKLMLNDFSIINSSTSTTTYLKIIRLLQAENLIDIIGEQAHAFTTTAAVATMKKSLDSLAATGLPIHITELDIDGTDDQVQLHSYKRIFPLLYEHPGVEGITLWGWRKGLWRDPQGAYIINQNGTERPSLVWLREYLDTVTIDPVSTEDIAGIPSEFQLHNNYPNPFNPTTTISFSIPYQANVKVDLVNILGQSVKTITNQVYNAGNHKLILDASDLASGIYFYTLQANDFFTVKKLMLMK